MVPFTERLMKPSARHPITEFPPHFHSVKSHHSKFFRAALLLFSLLGSAAAVPTGEPVIERQPYRVLYDTNHDAVGEWPPLDHPYARTDASSLVNIGCAIDLNIVASGTDLTYQWLKGGRVIQGANGSQLFINVESFLDAGVYQCVVSNPSGDVASQSVRIGVVGIEPTNHFLAVSTSSKATMSVAVKFPTTAGGFKYQWFKMLGGVPDLNADVMLANGGAISGATSAKLSVKVLDEEYAGVYYCKVTAYNTYMLAGYQHLAVVTQPQSTMVQVGQSMGFSVNPVGPSHLLGGLQYQWLKDGVEVENETTESYQIADVGTADAGLYSVAVTHPTLGTVTTPQAAAYVIDESVNQVLAIDGGRATLTAPVPPDRAQTYQWYRNGTPLSDGGKYGGTGRSKLSINPVEPSDAGDYECRGTLFGDTVVVRRAVLIVLPQPLSQVATLGGAFELEGLPQDDSSVDVNTALYQYQWFKGRELIEGETSASLSFATSNFTDASNYSLRLGYPEAASVVSKPASVAVVDTTPIVVNVNAGKDAKLKPVYSGKNVSFEWRKSGIPLQESEHHVGVAKNGLTIKAASLVDAGDDYECVISYPGGSSVSAPFEVVVYSAPEIVDFELPEMIVGRSVTYSITCTDDPLYVPGSYDAKILLESGRTSSLPKGLVVNKLTGEISGTPLVSGNFMIRVFVKNAVGTTTADSPLVINAMPEYLIGRFTGPLPRMPEGEFCDLGGRIDMLVTSTAAVSGKLMVGALSYSFKGTVSLDSTDPTSATGSAELMISRTDGNLTLTFELGSDNYLSNGSLTGAGNTVAFEGWRAVYTAAAPPAEYAGQFNIGLLPQWYGSGQVNAGNVREAIYFIEGTEPAAPEGISFASLVIDAAPSSDLVAGNYKAVGLMSDGVSKITSAGFVGPDGELHLYSVLYGNKTGSFVSSALRIDAESTGKPVTGLISWKGPNGGISARRYPDGFGPMDLDVVGGQYEPTGVEGKWMNSETGFFTVRGGGIDASATDPSALFNTSGGAITLIGDSPTKTAFSTTNSNLALGKLGGAFTLLDDNPATPRVSPSELKRGVKFYGMLVPLDLQGIYPAGSPQIRAPVGLGFCIIPQIPSIDPPTTTSNSAELSAPFIFMDLLPP